MQQTSTCCRLSARNLSSGERNRALFTLSHPDDSTLACTKISVHCAQREGFLMVSARIKLECPGCGKSVQTKDVYRARCNERFGGCGTAFPVPAARAQELREETPLTCNRCGHSWSSRARVGGSARCPECRTNRRVPKPEVTLPAPARRARKARTDAAQTAARVPRRTAVRKPSVARTGARASAAVPAFPAAGRGSQRDAGKPARAQIGAIEQPSGKGRPQQVTFDPRKVENPRA